MNLTRREVIKASAAALAFPHVWIQGNGKKRKKMANGLLDGLIEYYKCLDATGELGHDFTTVPDTFSFLNTGGPISGEGCLSNTGFGQYMTTDPAPDIADWNFDYSVMQWTKSPADSPYGPILYVVGETGLSEWDIGTLFGGGGHDNGSQFEFTGADGNDTSVLENVVTPPLLTGWHLTVSRWNNTTRRMRSLIDDTYAAELTATIGQGPSDPTNQIGYGNGFDGYLFGPAAIWKGVELTDLQCSQLWASGAGLPFADWDGGGGGGGAGGQTVMTDCVPRTGAFPSLVRV